METAITFLLGAFCGAVATVLIAALAGRVGDPDEETELNGPEFL
jgi:branched-subunit amino acid ABC-type transport system permease component